MNQCWASPLGGCSVESNKEHLVSKSILGKGVIVSGLPWCKGKEVRVGANSLSSKILCEYHNGKLSAYDSTAKIFFEALNQMQKDLKSWLHPPVKQIKVPIQFDVDYFNLERWFLKTLINFMVATGLNDLNVDGLLPYLYNNKPFKKPYGLYGYVNNNDRIENATLVKIQFKYQIVEKRGLVSGATFSFKDYMFLFVFSNKMNDPQPLNEIQDRWHTPNVIELKIPTLKTPGGVLHNIVTHKILFYNR